MPDTPCFYCEEPVDDDDSEVCTQCADQLYELVTGHRFLIIYHMEEAA